MPRILSGDENGEGVTKFMQVLSTHHHKLLEEEAKIRGCTVQQLIRVVIVPFWLRDAKLIPDPRPYLKSGVIENKTHHIE